MAPRITRGAAGRAIGDASDGATSTDASGETAGETMPACGRVPGPPPSMFDMLRQLRRHIETNCDYVGPSFPEEARRIFYGETSRRDIYGEASLEEAAALKEEGIETQRIPWLPRRDG